jgi:hypothetical protein
LREAIRELVKRGAPITFKSVAATAPCSTAYLYGNAEIRARIEHLRGRQRTPAAPPTPANENSPSNVVRALTAEIRKLKRAHAAEVSELRDALATAHGELLELRRRHRHS